MDEFAERLHAHLSGREEHPGDAELRALASLAGAIAALPLPEPEVERIARVRARFRRYVERYQRPRRRDGFLGWVGAGPRPRPLVQRLAAGAILFAAVFSGGAAATGESPLALMDRAADFALNAGRNLLPHGEPGTPTPPATPTAPPATPTPTSAEGAGATPPATPDPTPEPHEAEDDSRAGGEERDDARGRGTGGIDDSEHLEKEETPEAPERGEHP